MLKCDIAQYFPSIDHEILLALRLDRLLEPMQRRLLLMKHKEIIHIPHIPRSTPLLLDQVVQLIQIHIRKELTGLIPNGQPSGKSYEEDPEKLREQIAGFFTSKEGPGTIPSGNKGKLIKGLVAPNYEVKDSGPIYAWAYKELREAESPDVYIVIGIGHAGLDEPVAVTDKDFETPLGVVPVNRPIMDYLKAKGGDELFAEEIRHQKEHSIEPRNSSWITKVRASSWRTWQNTKMSHHHKGDHDFLYFTMHTNILHGFFAPNCRF